MDKESSTGSTGADNKHYYPEKVQSKKSKAFVLVITAFGTKKFKQEILDTLKIIDLKTVFDENEDNRIRVADMHGGNALKPDYHIPEEPSTEKAKRKRYKT